MLLQQHLYSLGLAQSLGLNVPSGLAAAARTAPNVNASFFLPSAAVEQRYLTDPVALAMSMQANSTGLNAGNLNHGFAQSNRATNEAIAALQNRSLDTSTALGRFQQNNATGGFTGRPAIQLYLTCDNESLSDYQCLVRKHIELFEAGIEDVDSNAQGRNRPIVLGQVGIRCRHCTMLPPRQRSRGAIYYPAKLQGIYQAAQNLAVAHLGEHCQNVPDDIRATLVQLRERKSSAGGGKRYWADGVRILGVYEDRDGLRFENQNAAVDNVTE
jgi:hypothetical protein